MKRLSIILILLLLSIFISVPVLADTLTLYESYTTGGDGDAASIYGVNWGAMQFTTGSTSHSIEQINLPLKRTGTTPSTITVSIRAVDVNHLPTGLDLCSGTINGNSLTTSYAWYPITVDSYIPDTLTEYAIVVRAIAGDSSNYIQWQMDTGGGLASAVSSKSVNSGLAWTSETPKDNLFEIYGTSSVSFKKVAVFNDYIEDGDLLFVAECLNTYEPYYPDYNASRYFQFRLLDVAGTTVLASTTYHEWGDKPQSIYLSASQASGLTNSAAYKLEIYGSFSPNPSVKYTLTSSDWQGSNLDYLDDWVILTASSIEDYYNIDLLVSSSDYGQQLNVEGGVIFETGIPSLKLYRPNLFSNTITKPVIDTHTPNPASDFNTATTYEAMLGTDVADVLDDLATFSGMSSGKDFGAFVLFALYFIVAILLFGKGHFSSGLGLSFPILGLAASFRLLDIQWVIALVVVFALLFVWSFWWSRT